MVKLRKKKEKAQTLTETKDTNKGINVMQVDRIEFFHAPSTEATRNAKIQRRRRVTNPAAHLGKSAHCIGDTDNTLEHGRRVQTERPLGTLKGKPKLANFIKPLNAPR